MIQPVDSDQLDYEAAMAVIIGKAGRRIAAVDVLSHVAG